MSISVGPGIGFAIQNGDGNNGSLVQAEGAYGWNGTGWDRARTATGDNATTGIMAQGNYLYSAGPQLWMRQREMNGLNPISNSSVGILAAGLMAQGSGGLDKLLSVSSATDGATTAILAEGQYGYNGTSWDRTRSNNRHIYQEYLLLTNGQHLDIWTPASGKKFRLMSVLIGSRVAAELILRDATNSTTYSNIATFNLGGRGSIAYDLRNGYISTTANNKLAVYNQTGSTVSLWATFLGTEE